MLLQSTRLAAVPATDEQLIAPLSVSGANFCSQSAQHFKFGRYVDKLNM